MPPGSPKRSSISSGKEGSPTRPRYLGLEVAGDHPPPFSTAAWEQFLRRHGAPSGAPPFRWRLIRAEGARAVVEVDHRSADAARSAWNASEEIGTEVVRVVSRRTWGTLRGAKSWLRADGRDLGRR